MKQELAFETLLDLVEGRLGEAEATEVTTLLREDEKARALVAWLQRFQQESEHTVLAEPPAALRQSLQEQFRARQQEQPQSEPLPA